MADKIKQKIMGKVHDVMSGDSDSQPQHQPPPHQQQHHPPPHQQQHHQQQNHPQQHHPQQHQHHPQHPQPGGPSLGPEFPLFTGGTYPRLTHLSDGSLLAILTRRAPEDKAERILQITRAAPGWDHASSSGAPQPHFELWGEVARGKGDVDNGYLLEIPPQTPGHGPGVILAAFRNHDLDNGRPTHFRITVCRSRDGGRTWQFAAQVAEKPGAGGMGLWEPFMRVVRDHQHPGRPTVHLTYSGELAHDDQETFETSCVDGEGSSWNPQPPRCLRCHDSHRGGPRLRDGMQGIAPLYFNPNGSGAEQQHLIMVMETTRHGHCMSVEYALSSDHGKSWSGGNGSRGVVYCPPQGRNAGSPQIAAVPGRNGRASRLAVVFMTDEDVAPGKLHWPAKAAVKMVFSEGIDERTGEVRWSKPPLTLAGPEPSAAWPGIMPAEAGVAGTARSGGHGGGGRPADEVLVSYANGGKCVARGLRF